VIRDAAGAAARLIGITMDITERRRAEAALRTSEARLAAFMEHSPGSMFIKGPDGRYLVANQAFLATMGCTADEVIGKSDFDLLPHPLASYFAEGDREVRESGEPRRIEENFTHNGHRFTSLTHKFPLPDGSIGCFTTDITDRKQTEERLRQLNLQEQAARAQAEEASRLKDEFLATVSHELRTPLTACLGYAQLLQRRKRDEAYIARTVDKMVQSALAQAALIEDLLDISRIVSGKLRLELAPIDLIDVINAALDTVRPSVEARSLQLQVELDPNAGPVLGDPGRLQQVVWNLLSNATKFTPPGGHIAVQLAVDEGAATLTVRDSGQGIHPDFLPYVFDRFRQAESSSHRAHGGLGLGLAIVRHLVELHGGSAEARSAGVGKGATFTIRLPVSGAGAAAGQAGLAADDAERHEGARATLGGLRVLVVDDQAPILELLVELLMAEGAMVQACHTAPEAVALLRSWRPDVLVSDIAMPGKDGYWLIEQVRSLPPEEGGATPAVALTAYVRMEDRLRVLAAGFQQYLAKPVDAAELRDSIRRLGASLPESHDREGQGGRNPP
jgi:PAS domain S-box-containing protein